MLSVWHQSITRTNAAFGDLCFMKGSMKESIKINIQRDCMSVDIVKMSYLLFGSYYLLLIRRQYDNQYVRLIWCFGFTTSWPVTSNCMSIFTPIAVNPSVVGILAISKTFPWASLYNAFSCSPRILPWAKVLMTYFVIIVQWINIILFTKTFI